MSLISVVIPVFNEEENLPVLFGRLENVIAALTSEGHQLEIILNDNHSTDGSWRLIEQFATQTPGARASRFARNYGFQASIIVGMRMAKGDAVVVLQSDLQDPPELITDMVSEWMDGYRTVACVIAKRGERGVLTALRKVFYWLLNLVSDTHHTTGFQDFYLLDRSVAAEVAEGPLGHQFVRTRVTQTYGIERSIHYVRSPRKHGHSKFNFPRLYSIALDGLLLNGHAALRLVALGSSIACFSSLMFLCLIFISWLGGVRTDVGGWMSLASLLLLLISLTALGFALVSEYLIRIYVNMMAPVSVQIDASVQP